MVRTPGRFATILTSGSASRHNGVQIFSGSSGQLNPVPAALASLLFRPSGFTNQFEKQSDAPRLFWRIGRICAGLSSCCCADVLLLSENLTGLSSLGNALLFISPYCRMIDLLNFLQLMIMDHSLIPC